MPYNEALAQRVRDQLYPLTNAEEKKMFGGIAFMVSGNMAVGVLRDDLIVRVGLENYESALRKTGVDLFQPTGKPMAGWITVASDGHLTDEGLKSWIEMALEFVETLPAK
jgi:TfoX/Sxy family transcriptional regulator of competence genes